MGEAYGFFYCRASKKQIEEELPDIRSKAVTPPGLELLLIEDPSKLKKDDEKLMQFVQQAIGTNLRYVFHAKFPEETNGRAANELADILINLYNSPLYEPDEPFRAEIVHEENGEYVRHE